MPIIKSGFKRDINDYYDAISVSQNQNLVFMKDLSSKIKLQFEIIENNSLDNELKFILKESKPFTELDTIEKLNELDNDTEILADVYSSHLNTILNKLSNAIESNQNEIDQVKDVFLKYAQIEGENESDLEQALVSLIFKDLKTIGTLKEFSKVLNRWNRTLLIYHTILKSKSPDDISLVEIQNGSIDVIFNIDFDIAIDLTDLIKTGLKVYGAYLIYKSKSARIIIESYLGNKKLIQMENEREKLMLDNIKESISAKLLEQHNERIKKDKNIEKPGLDKKIDQVASVIADHIVKGNEIKLLTPPKKTEENEIDIAEELREETANVRSTFKKLNAEEKQVLLDKYTIKDNEEN